MKRYEFILNIFNKTNKHFEYNKNQICNYKKIHSKRMPISYYIIKLMHETKKLDKITNLDSSIIIQMLSGTLIDFSHIYSQHNQSINVEKIENIISKYCSRIQYHNVYNEFNIFRNNLFLSQRIIHYIETTDLIKINVNIDNIQIDIYSEYCIDNIDNLININNIIIYCKFFQNLRNNYKNIHLILIPTRFKKEIYNNNKSLFTVDNINSGSTCINEYILIWRLEELEKVLIHELIHYFNIDTLMINRIKNYYLEKFIFIGSDVVIESLTESIAIILFSFFNSFNLKNFDEI